MNRELLMLVDAISREKSAERDVVFGAVELRWSRYQEALCRRSRYSRRLIAKAANTKPSVVGWSCLTRLVCKIPRQKKSD